MAVYNLNTGEHVNYQGRSGVIIGNSSVSCTITIEFDDGTRVTISKEALSAGIFGVSNPYEKYIKYCKDKINNYNQEYEERMDIARFCLDNYFRSKKEAKLHKVEAQKILPQGKDVSTLTTSQKEEYNNAMNAYTESTKEKNEYNRDFWINNSAAFECAFSGNRWEGQCLVANTKRYTQSIFCT